MGSYENMHLGPVAEYTPTKSTREVKGRGCTNTACSRHRVSYGPEKKFCEDCGAAYGPISYSEEYEVDYHDICEDENLSIAHVKSDKRYLMPNVRRGEPRDFSFDEGDIVVLDFSEAMQKSEMEWFAKAFEEDIAKLKEHFQDVTVRWGLIRFYR